MSAIKMVDRLKRAARAKARARAGRISRRRGREMKIIERLGGLIFAERGSRMFVFYPAGHEPELRGYYRNLLARGVRLCFPRVRGARMTFHAVPSLRALAPGRFGIPEPAESSPEQIPGVDDIVLTPALAFDAAGTRIGRGLGYYDRYYQEHPDGFRVGVCFESQLAVDRLHRDAHDEPVHAIVTDAGTRFVC